MLKTTLPAISALSLGLAMSPANAATSRIMSFLFLCDGTNKAAQFLAGVNFPALPASTTVFVVATEVVLFENQGGLQYVLVAAKDGPPSPARIKQLANVGLPPSARQPGGGEHVFNSHMFSSIPLTTNQSGETIITVDAACNPGFGQLQGTVTVWFTGPGIP